MTGKTKLGIIIAIVALSVLAYGYLGDSSRPSKDDKQAISANKASDTPQDEQKYPAPDFTLKNLNGDEVTLSDLKGKIVFINFWATWCGPCREEIPAFVDLQKKYGSDKLAILGISVDQGTISAVPEFAKNFHINYEILYATADVVKKYGGISGIPTTFVVDRDGYLRDRMVGFPGKDYFDQVINFLM
jgi:peroxiredoxin